MLLFVFFAILALSALSDGLALTCENHPAYFSNLKPELISSWDVVTGNGHSVMNYHPRFKDIRYAPIDDLESTKYAGLDWFWASMDDEQSGDDFVRLNFQRHAKVYLFVFYDYDPEYPDASLPGWTSEEYVDLVDGETDRFKSGVHQTMSRYLPSRGFLFSQDALGSIVLPHHNWVVDNVKGLKARGWYAMVAEKDGSAPKKPAAPEGVDENIEPNQRCPDELHDKWVTRNTDDSDPDTGGKMWRTWHPTWDPCYWCAYDHDHGSSPKDLMGYEPKFGYTAWKNGRELEEHAGFKGFVFASGDHLVYFMLHAQSSSLRKLATQFHSITMVVVNAKTKELELELTHKGFYGFLASRAKDGTTDTGMVPFSEEDAELEQKLRDDGGAFNRRAVNSIDVDNLDDRLRYRSPREDILRGEYEDWSTNPICTPRGRNGMISVDITNPGVGVNNMVDKEEVVLGFYYGDDFFRHDSSSRILIFREFHLSEELCIFKLRNVEGGRYKDGVFYTDVYGESILGGPGKDALRQFIKPEFDIKLDGVYRPVDAWTQLFEEKEHSVQAVAYGFGLDPTVN